VLGISSVAPGYTLTVGIGLIVTAVVLLDTIAALGIMICWDHRVRLRLVRPQRAVQQRSQRGVQIPVPVARRHHVGNGLRDLGGRESMNPENASGGSIFGILHHIRPGAGRIAPGQLVRDRLTRFVRPP
jgi:hypothetical protein